VLALGDDGARVWVLVFWASGAGWEPLWAPMAPFGERGTQAPTDGHWTWPERV
jgi:hypothetical protein